jgi:hypothetical protein
MPQADQTGHPDAKELLAEIYVQDGHLIPDTAE